MKNCEQTYFYSKEKLWSRQLFQETDIGRETVYFRTIDRKLIMNLIVIFNSFTDISFLKYVTKRFSLLLFPVVFLYILSSKGANELQLLYIRTFGNIQGKFITEAEVLKCFRTSENLAMENYVLAYHTANKDHTDIL